MTFYNLLKKAIENINAPADLYVFDEVRFANASQNFERAAINLNPDFTSKVNKTPSAQLLTDYSLKIKFVDRDEWDNSNVNQIGYSEGTLAIIERMRILANSILFNIFMDKNNYSPSQSLKPRLWTFKNILPHNINTMSGVECSLNITLVDKRVCEYKNV